MKNNKGMTIVEVMVAFVLLMIGLGGLFKATQFSTRLINRANERQQNVDAMMREYYENEPVANQTQTVTFSAEGKSWNMQINMGESDYTTEDGETYQIRYYGAAK